VRVLLQAQPEPLVRALLQAQRVRAQRAVPAPWVPPPGLPEQVLVPPRAALLARRRLQVWSRLQRKSKRSSYELA